MEADLRRSARHRRGRPAPRALPSVLGDRRQRRQPHRRRGGADQALRALLQGDRLRRHRGQEAHRPLVRADDPGLRRRAPGLDGRRRRQGGRHLPGPQGGPDRDRQRGRGALQRGPARHLGSGRRSPAGVRALGHGRPPLRLRGGAGDRRPGPPAARGACRHRRPPWPAASVATARRCWRSCDRACSRSPARYFDGLRAGDYDGHLEASTAVRLASLWRYALGISPLEAYQLEYGKVGTPGVVLEDLVGALTQRHRRAHPSRRRHQAPGQDGHGRHLPQRRDAPPGSAGQAGPGRRAPPATASATRPCAPSPRSSPSWRRCSATPGTPSTATSTRPATTTPPWSWSTAAASAGSSRSRTADDPELRGTKRWVAVERTVLVARGRSDGRTVIIVPEVKDGEPTGLTLLHVRLADGPVAARAAGGPPGLPEPLRRHQARGHRDRAGVPRRPSRRRAGGRPHDRAGQRSGGTLAVVTGGVVGIGTDLVDLDRFRHVLARRPTLVERLFTTGSGSTRSAAAIPSSATRCASRPRRRC